MTRYALTPKVSPIGLSWRLLSLDAAPGRGVFLMMSAALLAICGIFGVVMVESRADARRVAESFGLNLATALAQDLARNVELLDLSIDAARYSWMDPRVRALEPKLRQMVVFDHSASAQYIDSVLVLAPDGSVLADSRSVVPRETNYAQADFFRAQIDRDAGLFISRPMKDVGRRGWNMAFSRRISDADGRFAGVAVGVLDLEYLNAAYKRLDLGQGGSLFLFKMDGTMLAREPADARAIGRSFAGTAAFEGMARAKEGSFEAVSTIDGRSRLYNFHRVGDLPLTQGVAVSTASVFADWLQRSLLLGSSLFVLCAGALALLFVLKRELSQRVAAESALKELASKDDLTGLLNRRRFFELTERRLVEAGRTAASVSVLMIDADHFKSYNDRYGHVAGDAVLMAIGHCISGEIRDATDVAARFGGEEFIVFLFEAGRERAFMIAEAIRSAIARLGTAHERSAAGIVTVSIGVATAQAGEHTTLGSLVEAADAELYRSKRSGRNQSSAQTLTVDPASAAPLALSA